jgi:glycosyltransferase involved in cell wall biosynthesis
MRIVVLHSPYLTGPASGENRVVGDEVELLRRAGHDVSLFTPERLAGQRYGPRREGFAAIWSQAAVKAVRRLIQEQRAEVVHCHNLFPALSPAVLRAADDAGVALVATLHNYRLLCLPATFLLDGEVCERCLGKLPWRGVVHQCYRHSVLGSAALAVSLGLHRGLRTFDHVDLYLAVSDFVRAKHVEAGFAADRIVVKPNFAPRLARREGPGHYFLYAGRLAADKDVSGLLEAWRSVGEARLVVAGTGPDEDRLRARAPAGVDFRGLVPPAEVRALLADARALILPSLSYEGAPLSVVEAYAAGVPVLANAIGALPEVVEDGISGILVPPRDPAALAGAVRRLAADVESERLGEGAWGLWRSKYTPERALEALEAVYQQALRLRRAGN